MTEGGDLGYEPIGSYALIGDCRSGALVSRLGSIDWLCWPRFDSSPLFGALLDRRRGGSFSIRPVRPFETTRRYIPDTNVLETVFRCEEGSVALRDLFPVASEPEKNAGLLPEHHLLREVEGLGGRVTLQAAYEPRGGYGSAAVRIRDRNRFGLWSPLGRGILLLSSTVQLEVHDRGARASASFAVENGERATFWLGYSQDAPAVVPSLDTARPTIERTVNWWSEWASRCAYQGPYRDAVMRSALAIKLLSHAPSGAILAAPTTSLPEQIGGSWNWDYRFCWLRDASLTTRALLGLGYRPEAMAFLNWMRHATRLTWPRLQVVYSVYGDAKLPERQRPDLEGYRDSKPVRTGNDAYRQLQLDVYGEVIAGVALFVEHGERLDRGTSRWLDGLGHTVVKLWREPDEGIWEARSGRFDHTFSKAMCWVALDNLIRMHGAGHIKVCVDEFRDEREVIRAEIEARGYNSRIESYTRWYDSEDVDGSLLLLPIYRYIDATEPRMRATCDRIRRDLGSGPLLYRYLDSSGDGQRREEGAFGACSFWAVECLALGGELDAAVDVFERLLGLANDLGLYGEEIDPATGAAIGNFPQAFTHLGLINAALTLDKMQALRSSGPGIPT